MMVWWLLPFTSYLPLREWPSSCKPSSSHAWYGPKHPDLTGKTVVTTSKFMDGFSCGKHWARYFTLWPCWIISTRNQGANTIIILLCDRSGKGWNGIPQMCHRPNPSQTTVPLLSSLLLCWMGSCANLSWTSHSPALTSAVVPLSPKVRGKPFATALWISSPCIFPRCLITSD
jgi:hypothetical protein